jgi:hypothetical protein
MSIDHAKGRGLEAQMQQHAHKNRVLVDVGKIAGMKCVAIIHEPLSKALLSSSRHASAR